MPTDDSLTCQGREPTAPPPRNPRGWTIDTLVGGALLLLALAVLLPQYGRHYHYQGSRFHGYLKTLYTRSALWNIEHGSPLLFRTNGDPYTHHPQLLIVFLQLGYLFDRDFSHAESVPIAFSLLTCLVLFVSVRLLWSRTIAVYTLLAFLLSPAFVLFGTFVNFEPPCLFFMLLGWSLYAGWWHTGRTGFFVASLLALFIGCMTDWPAYFLTGSLAVHALLTRREEGLGVSMVLGFVGVFSFACFLLFCVFAQTGSFGGGLLWESFVNRIGLSPVVAPMAGSLDPDFVIHYTVGEWLGRIGYHLVELNGVGLTFGALVWMVGYTLGRKPRQGWGPEGWVLVLLAPAVLNHVLFNGLVWQHPFFAYYFLPGFALAGALVLDRVCRFFDRKVLSFGCVVAFFAVSISQTASIVGRYLP